MITIYDLFVIFSNSFGSISHCHPLLQTRWISIVLTHHQDELTILRISIYVYFSCLFSQLSPNRLSSNAANLIRLVLLVLLCIFFSWPLSPTLAGRGRGIADGSTCTPSPPEVEKHIEDTTNVATLVKRYTTVRYGGMCK